MLNEMQNWVATGVYFTALGLFLTWISGIAPKDLQEDRKFKFAANTFAFTFGICAAICGGVVGLVSALPA